jgi:integral membrane protein
VGRQLVLAEGLPALFRERQLIAARHLNRLSLVNLRSFRYVALAEATTFLALLVASIVKRTGGEEIGVQILGPIHGLLFIAYVVIALNLREEVGWTNKQIFWILVGAVLPFGGYVVDWWLSRRERAGPTS